MKNTEFKVLGHMADQFFFNLFVNINRFYELEFSRPIKSTVYQKKSLKWLSVI